MLSGDTEKVYHVVCYTHDNGFSEVPYFSFPAQSTVLFFRQHKQFADEVGGV